ncbi:MAG: hypothetical protein COA70_01315 [Planctomycetota bacterium]|nr:MAG: hypothetical protein COA70_01315 [Planctomycetota bacterium]
MTSTQIERLPDGLRLTRIFNAPREQVFAAWTDPSQISQWWGCAQTSSVDSTVDLRVGGEYRHNMEMSHGTFDMVGIFTIVEPPEHLAYSMKGEMGMPDSVTDVRLREVDGGTELTLLITGLSDETMQGFVSEGWSAGMEKLEKVLQSLQL